jgi:4-nitrophenyl phosphatase
MDAMARLNNGGQWAPDGLIVDLDGVLYRGNIALDGLAEFAAVSSAWPRVLLTNNSTVRAADCARKLNDLGITIAAEQILTVSAAMAAYLSAAFAPGASAYVIGERPLRDAIAGAGLVPGGDQPAAVVVGLDRELRYAQLAEATRLLRAGRPLIATSLDPVLLTADGAVPGAGAIVAALRASSGAEPVCVGKPAARFFQAAMARLGVCAERVLVIGDSLAADIAGGQAAGARTALMLSGVTAHVPDGGPRPDHVFGSLPELTGFLRERAA